LVICVGVLEVSYLCYLRVFGNYFLGKHRGPGLFMLCIMPMCQLIVKYIIIVARFIIVFCLLCSLFEFSRSSFVRLLFHLIFCFFIVHCSLFKRKIFDSDLGLYSRYFDPVVQEPSSSSIQVNKHHTSDCTDFILV
jgi:hypothetical protein